MTKKTADANDGDHSGRSYVAMGRLVTRQCDCGDRNSGRNTQGHRRSGICSCRRSLYLKWAGLFIAAYLRVRVFGPSVLVDRTSHRLYVHTISLSRCVDRHSCYRRGTLLYYQLRGEDPHLFRGWYREEWTRHITGLRGGEERHIVERGVEGEILL